jgi:hypothetical protein
LKSEINIYGISEQVPVTRDIIKAGNLRGEKRDEKSEFCQSGL